MSDKSKTPRSPMSQDRIFLIVMVITFAVAAVFFIKNIMGGNMQSALIIGACLAVFAIAVFLMRKLHAPTSTQIMLLCILLVLLVLFISLNSGDFYSDDFPMFLALLGLTGLYLEPKCTAVQWAAIDVALVIMYMVHPEKADPLSQYGLCYLIFNVAAFVNFMVIRRGRAYIELSKIRAAEAEHLVEQVKNMGVELQNSFNDSSHGLNGLRSADQQLEQNTQTLLQGSHAVHQDSQELTQVCTDVRTCVHDMGGTVAGMANHLHRLEDIMAGSKDPMQAMYAQMDVVKATIEETTQVFQQLQNYIQQISGLTGELDNIALNTKMLALNASVEAARAGEYGVGFAVVAGEVETLAANSSTCSTQVTEVVDRIKKQVSLSGAQLEQSYQAMNTLHDTLYTLDHGFLEMGPQFESMFQSIGQQERSFSQLDTMFDGLESKVNEVSVSADGNRETVDAIVDTVSAYKACTDRLMEDTKALCDLSISLVEDSGQ